MLLLHCFFKFIISFVVVIIIIDNVLVSTSIVYVIGNTIVVAVGSRKTDEWIMVTTKS